VQALRRRAAAESAESDGARRAAAESGYRNTADHYCPGHESSIPTKTLIR